MKNLFIKIIKFYQRVPGKFHNSCKYIPSCSNYALEAITEYGALKGGFMSLKRILKCNPFSKGGIDLVPRRGEKNEKNN